MLYFVLRDGAALWTAILRSCSPEVRPATDRAGRRAWEVLGGSVRGTAMVARARSCSRSSRAAAESPPPGHDLVAVAAGGSLFGIAGAYLAVPVTAVVSAVYASLTSDESGP
jgi:putative heme transporter